MKASNHKSSGKSTSPAAKSGRSSRKVSAKGKRTSKQVVARSRGQQGIAPERAREIQEALIKANYLGGEPSGVWDQDTQRALTRFQADNGWQSKVVPDSRALIKLGLGPDHANVINPSTSGVLQTPAAPNSSAQLQPGGATSN